MTSIANTPGLFFTTVPRPVEASPLRSDVAGFIGRTKRGPIGKPVRVDEWRGYVREFGGLLKDSSTTYAIRGYFENGGEVAYVIRLAGEKTSRATGYWNVGGLDASREWTVDAPTTFGYSRYKIEATSPGAWANETRVSIRYRFHGPSGAPEVDVAVRSPGEPEESFPGLALDSFDKVIESRSLLIRMTPENPPKSGALASGPNHVDWEIRLQGGSEFPPSKQDYLEAVSNLADVNQVEFETLIASGQEVALIAVPGLYEDLEQRDEQEEVLVTLIAQAERSHDRLALIDVPSDGNDEDDSIDQVNNAIQYLRDIEPGGTLRAAAVYHPALWVPDPLGGVARPLRRVPPSGHVAGLISRLDRERGPHHTPANATLFEAVDVTRGFGKREQARFHEEGINLVRCFPGRGLVVWGGRTFDRRSDMVFIAHRRLIHRLIRAIRRVAEPLVFDINGPELRLTIVRAITTVLLEAWRGGALKGTRPDEAFRVRCDETTTPPEEEDLGRVFCEIEVAPAVPMEFITLRIALSTDGELEVIES